MDVNSLFHSNLEQFSKSGLKNADLRSFGNVPVLSDRLLIRVTTGAMTSTQYGRNVDRTGSERQVDFGEFKIKLLISAVATGSNKEKKQVQADQKNKMD